MTTPTFDQDFWEQLWSRTLREHGDKVARRPPNTHPMAEAAGADISERIDWIESDLANWRAEHRSTTTASCACTSTWPAPWKTW
jgi:hypothetical protein